MTKITPTTQMIAAAKQLNTGPIIYTYRDGNAVRMETEYGDDPYVWRRDRWRAMIQRP